MRLRKAEIGREKDKSLRSPSPPLNLPIVLQPLDDSADYLFLSLCRVVGGRKVKGLGGTRQWRPSLTNSLSFPGAHCPSLSYR